MVCINAAPLRIRGLDDPPHFMQFIGPDGEVGYLDWEEGQLTFSGDIGESARIFFNYLGPLVEVAARAMKEEDEWKHFVDPNL